MFSDKFAYLFGASLFSIPWIILFKKRKELRKEMLITSSCLTVIGVLAEWIFYTQDWWKPATITGTLIGIEDVLLGFFSGGIASVIYKEVFHKTIYKNIHLKISHWKIAIPLSIMVFGTAILFTYGQLYSYYANTIALGLGLILISFQRKDLIEEMVGGGLLLTLITLPVYWLTFLIFPLWKYSYWNYENISGLTLLWIPYEDIIWWMFAGAFAAVFYDYIFSLNLRNKAK